MSDDGELYPAFQPLASLRPRPGMRFTFWQPAGTFHVPGKGEAEQRFGQHSWDSQIGKTVRLTFRDTPGGPERAHPGRARIVAADVAADGSGVTITYEVLDDD